MTDTKACEICGTMFGRNARDYPARWARRQFCSRACSARAHLPAAHKASAILGHKYVETRRADLVEDVEFLLQQGANLDEVARRLGRTVGALARGLYRAGRPDLASPFERLRKYRDRGTCMECGAETSRYGRRCVPCSLRNRRAA